MAIDPQEVSSSLFSLKEHVTLGVQPSHVFEDKLCKSDRGVLGPTSQPTDMPPVHSVLCSTPIPEPSLCARLY